MEEGCLQCLVEESISVIGIRTGQNRGGEVRRRGFVKRCKGRLVRGGG